MFERRAARSIHKVSINATEDAPAADPRRTGWAGETIGDNPSSRCGIGDAGWQQRR